MELKPVEDLRITILVDNYVDVLLTSDDLVPGPISGSVFYAI